MNISLSQNIYIKVKHTYMHFICVFLPILKASTVGIILNAFQRYDVFHSKHEF